MVDLFQCGEVGGEILKKFAFEIVCFLCFVAIGVSCYIHCKGVPGLARADAVTPGTDWVLIIQIVSGVLVAVIGAAPSLYRTYKAGGLKKAIKELEDDAEMIVEKVEPILTPEQLAKAKAMLEQGHKIGDAYDSVKKQP